MIIDIRMGWGMQFIEGYNKSYMLGINSECKFVNCK